ncbi:MAG: hypothetical protein F4109_11425, partial [Gammaproteobacteria bacterium]|nr:hypothetical protein [Gammaproteobacteria bacterium]
MRVVLTRPRPAALSRRPASSSGRFASSAAGRLRGAVAALLLGAPLLALSFLSLASQVAAEEVQTNCPGPRTGDKRVTDDKWDYEKHNVYGLGCLNVEVAEVSAAYVAEVSAAYSAEGTSETAEGSSKRYAFRVTSEIAPGPLGIPHGQYFRYGITLGGTAKEGEDYKFVPGQGAPMSAHGYLFDSSKQWNRPGAPRRVVTSAYVFRVLDDDEVEPDETVTFTISYRTPWGGAAADYQIGTASATFTIQNDDVAPTPQRPRISIEPGTSSITEGTAATFKLTATPAPAAPLSVTVTVATDGDYGITAGEKTYTIPTTGSYELTLATDNDGADEPNGSVSATVDAGDSYTVDDDASSGTVAIADDDAPPVVAFASASSSADEAAGTRDVTINLAPAPAAGILLAYGVSGTATPGSGHDFTIANSGTVSIPSGAATAIIPVTINDDSIDENSETVVLTLTDGADYTLGAVKIHTLTITDNDDPAPDPEVSVSAGGAVTEGGKASFTVSASPAPSAPLDVTLTVAQSGDVAASGATGSRTVTVPVT